jgi:REP element-mobilizing transposase RayT
MSPYDPQKHHRRSIRLKGYNYALPGAYFITLVTYKREHLFGRVVNGKLQLSKLGSIVREEWLRSILLRWEIRLFEDEFVVMPNHVHGIVWIVDSGDLIGEGESTADPVGADGVRP